MKKLLFILSFLPFVSFGDFVSDYISTNGVFNYTSYIYVGGSSPIQNGSRSTLSLTSVYSYWSSSFVPFSFNPSSFNITVPNLSQSSSTVSSYIYPFSIPGTNITFTAKYFESINSSYVLFASLIRSGYRPSSSSIFSDTSSLFRCNFRFSDVLVDVLTGTNVLYRQLVLNHLSSIRTSVQNIEINVSGLQFSIEEGNNTLSNIYQNTTSAISTLSDISQSSFSSAVSLSQVSSNTLAAAGSLSQVSSNTLAAAGSLSQVSSNTSASVSALSDISSNTSSAASSLDDISNLIGPEEIPGSLAYYVGKGSSDLHYINEQTRTGSDDLNSIKNYIGASLSGNGSPSPDNPWFPYDPNNPSDPNHPMNPNSPWNSNSPNSISGGGGQGAFTTNNVVRPVTNSVRQASADIQSNAVANADRQIDNATSIWDDFRELAFGDGEGLNVRIKFPLWESDGYHVNVRDDAVVSAIENLHAMPVELTAIKDNIQWFKDGGPLNVNFPSNLVDMLDEILDAITNRPVNSYLLLDDYSVYISNGVYQSSIEQLESDFPNVYTNLLKYGLSSDGNGNFWTLFGANLIYQSGLIGSLLEDMATIRKFADDHIEGGFSAGIASIVSQFPSATQLQDDVNNSTGQVVQINLATTNFVFSFESVTNVAPSVFKPFADSFDSPPTGDIVFFKTANDQYVSIPVHAQASVWSLIRHGIAFALVGVQFLLFPKFVLAVVVLFSRLSNRFIKFVPNDR